MGRTSKMNSLVVSSAACTMRPQRLQLTAARGRRRGPRAAARSPPGARCWRGSGRGRRASGARCRGAAPPGLAAASAIEDRSASAGAVAAGGATTAVPGAPAANDGATGRGCGGTRLDQRRAPASSTSRSRKRASVRLLAFEDLLLRLEQRRPPAECQQLAARLPELVGVRRRRRARARRRAPLPSCGAPSWRSASEVACWPRSSSSSSSSRRQLRSRSAASHLPDGGELGRRSVAGRGRWMPRSRRLARGTVVNPPGS